MAVAHMQECSKRRKYSNEEGLMILKGSKEGDGIF